jgi:hypothetical protein
MANTYSWSFEALDVELGPDAHDHTDVVYTIRWRYAATDGQDPPHTAEHIGISSVKWEEGDPWIPYADLTKSDIEGWTEDEIGEDEMEEMKQRLDAKIAEQVAPTHERNRTMPWDEDNGA